MDPVTALGAAGSIIGIAGFGLQVATTLQTYAEATLEADDRIRDIANDISATASALQRLQAVIVRDDKLPQGRIFSIEGLNVVNKIASQCDAVFTRIVELLNKAGKPGGQLSNSERAKDLRLSTLDHLKWPWLEPKIARCRQELERLLLKLLLMLQISNLAGQQATTLGNISSQQALEKQLAHEKQLREVIAKLKGREERLTHSLEAAIFGSLVQEDRTLWGRMSGRDIVTAVPRVSSFKPEGSSTVLQREARRSLERQQPAQNAGRENIETSKTSRAPPDPGDSQENGIPEGSVEQKNSKSVGFDESTKPNHRDAPLEAAAFPEETSARPRPQPERAQPPIGPETPAVKQRLEVYLITKKRGDRDEMYLLKLPLRQEELKKQMDTVLARTQAPIWDTLISLTPEEQSNVHYALDYSKQQDKIEPILVAIEVKQAAEGLIASEPRQILLFLAKEAGNSDNQALGPQRPTYTRMSRRHVSIETLNRYRLSYEFDMDPEYIVVKRWVPEYEQELLWNHTREIRERRRKEPILIWEERRKHSKHQHYDDELQLVIEKKKKHPSPSPLLQRFAGSSRKTTKHSSTNIDQGGDRKHSSKPNPSPLLTFISGRSRHAEDIPEADEKRDEVVDDRKVDDLLAKYTTTFKEDGQVGKKVETERQDKQQEKKDESGEISSSEEDRLGEEFLQSTKLDDYFSDDEHSVGLSSLTVRRTRRSQFMRGLRKLWPSALPRIRFSRRRGSVSSGSASGSSSSLVDD